MPTYEYHCQTCSHRFEQWQKMTDDPLETCPECGGHIRRVFFPAGIVFKGSGFYKTDHRNASNVADNNENGHAAKGEEAAKSGEAGKAKAASESKPAATESGSGKTGTSRGENKVPTATSTVTK
ncbi:MAG: hypothetical protein AUG45_07805 [Ktedonobacter sp. 13_1_20CM_3_54_15]|jgi:putative FmdB family regulatory protein|nr:MAG: hypothetical protein AUH05_18850 [Ktedonobacter sp. 13_2_20CM_53_11]OLD82924.1 MAG: hypothetical protein AUG54_02270 [Ktedonobacter sp. 13_1_20CM_4_53_7]OLE33281.1 MAG: hypothetical protein AUG45_07805 [Ktedonobacter sp. 13_1_20CM_3_54_15]TMC25473.1 MAG: zinc ribbon domain-containing protein [Chloroflexota bacterium]TMC39304.1 MAG: zinc ribbon domain-containing protein [Chloroflexota bacterium]